MFFWHREWNGGSSRPHREKLKQAISAEDLDAILRALPPFLAECDGNPDDWTLVCRDLAALYSRRPDLGPALKEPLGRVADGLLKYNKPGRSEYETCMAAWAGDRLVARPLLEHGTGAADLRRALDIIVESLRHSPFFLTNQVTRARILLALGRAEEAFEIVRWVDEMLPGSAPLERFGEAYRAWLQADHEPRLHLPRSAQSDPLPPLMPGERSKGREPLTEVEVRRLFQVRCGENEWVRARNAALVALLHETKATLGALLDLTVFDVSLGAGPSIEVGGEKKHLSGESAARVAHWYILASCHPRFHKMKHVFVDDKLVRLTSGAAEEVIAKTGKLAGMKNLTAPRLRRTVPEEPEPYTETLIRRLSEKYKNDFDLAGPEVRKGKIDLFATTNVRSQSVAICYIGRFKVDSLRELKVGRLIRVGSVERIGKYELRCDRREGQIFVALYRGKVRASVELCCRAPETKAYRQKGLVDEGLLTWFGPVEYFGTPWSDNDPLHCSLITVQSLRDLASACQ